MSKIYFATKAYNAEKTIVRCIESVLNQTCFGDDIVYYICNNGSTDKTGAIIEEYAKKDKRIKVFNNKENHIYNKESNEYENLRCNINIDDYFCALDSDDAYELDFLEKVIPFMQSNELDIAACGSNFIDGKTEEVLYRRFIENELLLKNKKEFSDCFCLYYQFMRPVWGKIFTGKVAKKSYVRETLQTDGKLLGYGTDTIISFSMLKNAERVGVLPDLLHNYYIYEKSVSHQYSIKQLDAIILLYEDAINFLSKYGEISVQNIEYINNSYIEECIVLLTNLRNCNLSADEKFVELLRLVSNDIMKDLLKKCVGRFNYLKYMIRTIIIENISGVTQANERILIDLFNEFLNDCKDVFDFNMVPLFVNEPSILQMFIIDERIKLLKLCFELIEDADRYKKEYNLGCLILKLIPENTYVSAVKEPEFFELYSSICCLILSNKNTEALSEMTEIMLSGQEVNCPEDFLNIYIKLAALENHVEAFLFGNIQKAYLFLDENRKDEARQIVNDLVEMGAGESEDVVALKEMLN